MSAVGSIGIAELIVILCACCVPIIVAAGVVIGVLVWMGRRKPTPAPQKVPPRAPAPPPQAEPVVTDESDPTPGAKAVGLSDVAMRSCPSCGADNPADNSFCEYCGAPLAEDRTSCVGTW